MAEDRESALPQPQDSLALLGASRGEADAYLRKQREMLDLQIEDLRKREEYENSFLRWRRFNDQMKGAMQIMLVLVGALFVFALSATVWSAAHEDGVVIEAFNVPPDMVQRGLTGSVVSSMLLDRLIALQSQIDSARAPSSYSGNSDDIKVLIPDTGISISEAYRYLVGWLGHQTHISGEIYRSAKGITVVVRTSGVPGASFEGNQNDLNPLMQRAADAVYRQTQPFRYAVHLLNYGHNEEADVVLNDLIANGPASEKPWAYAIAMYPALARGDVAAAIARTRTAAALDPDNLLATANVTQTEAVAGHDEEVLRFDHASKAAAAAGGGDQIRPLARISMGQMVDANLAEEVGDYSGAIVQYDNQLRTQDFTGSHWTSAYMKAADLAMAHDVAASRQALGQYRDSQLLPRTLVGSGWNQTNVDFPQFEQFAALGDWAAARKDLEAVAALPVTLARGVTYELPRVLFPRLALARAKTRDFEAAWREIAKTPLDCYDCVRARGQIAAEQKNANAAATWFARAVRLAPSIPFAYAEWGAMLLAQGKTDAAIAKFSTAHEKGPRFADPLEAWGEALIRQNRSDLALAKFGEANKYAPHWARLHLKWGEALHYLGRNADAQKQFEAARSLWLTPFEKSELARVSHG